MTAQQLIVELQKLPADQQVNIAVRTFTQAHDVAYVETRIIGNVIFACLPEGYVVSKRKVAASVVTASADTFTVLYRTYATKEEAELNAADVRKNGSPCVAKPNPDQSNAYARWAIFVQPLGVR
jgi:hypothetical protein